VDPRDVFNEAVNYHKVDPDRCENCGFCVLHEIEGDKGGKPGIIYLCSCKKNLRENEYTRELFCKYSAYKDIRELGDMIEVEKDCVCNNYIRVKD